MYIAAAAQSMRAAVMGRLLELGKNVATSVQSVRAARVSCDNLDQINIFNLNKMSIF
jgi:hypothetical protein